ncbi:MAG: amidase [Candidatus Heimdallarchaeota archaeon]
MKEYSITELQELMVDGKITATKITEKYLNRIKEIDKAGPKINSIIEINPDAIQIAERLDDERKNGNIRGPLHGIPVIIKDNIGTADKMMTTAGSLALEGHIPIEDSFIVKLLRDAGAIILAKANLSEWANFRSTRSASGWSSRGKQTLNPYVLDRSPCGSSSGSAVAVAANLCVVAIGTETDGSVICPSTINSIVGIKPTVGLISRTGVIPISHTQDTAGPMGRTVQDAAILLGELVAEDSEDTITSNDSTKDPIDYTQFLDKDGINGARIGVARNFFGKNDRVDAIMEGAIEKMRELGAEIIDPANITSLSEFRDAEYAVLLFEFKHDLNEYIAKYLKIPNIKSMEDIIEFNENNKEKVMPYFSQEIFYKSIEKEPLTSDEYKDALEKCRKFSREEGLDKVLKEHNLDAIIAPSGGLAWPIDWANGDHFTGGSSSAAAVAGYPNITVPVGYVHGLPLGISFMGGAFQEPTLIKLAYAFEQATKVRQPPKYLPKIVYD